MNNDLAIYFGDGNYLIGADGIISIKGFVPNVTYEGRSINRVKLKRERNAKGGLIFKVVESEKIENIEKKSLYLDTNGAIYKAVTKDLLPEINLKEIEKKRKLNSYASLSYASEPTIKYEQTPPIPNIPIYASPPSPPRTEGVITRTTAVERIRTTEAPVAPAPVVPAPDATTQQVAQQQPTEQQPTQLGTERMDAAAGRSNKGIMIQAMWFDYAFVFRER